MSQKKEYHIRCPKCGSEQQPELYEAVNIGSEPDLKARLMRNQLNVVTCSQCGLAFRVDKALLYHDPERKIMIYLVPLNGASMEEGARQFGDCLNKLNGILPTDMMPPSVHLVFSQVELVERIFLLEAGLNERIVEYIKHTIYANNMSKLNPAENILLFNAEDSTDENLCFVVQDARSRKLVSMLTYERKAYRALCEMFDNDEKTPSLLELFPGPYISARAQLLQEQAPGSEQPAQG